MRTMMKKNQRHGVIDRIVDGAQAVIIDQVTNQTYHAEVGKLPSSSEEGSHVTFHLFDDTVQEVRLAEDERKKARQRAAESKARLQKKAGSRFKK
ncbi:Protein of unknown function (DUF3006) [Salsuginibacillus halophilus]|uniref:DUF3006 family protein n=1 Tax=Salsuginibacillus halophilus TaxID=517424 RepID=A0A2P8HBG4_9BACI|nr:DUF3006 domain-containing protein [Salsuginibacillus halophilus]PSL43539.1 Protein of unknown function (DUF3006) [Salsuginibacillus halophilus]